jgi:hypothetical protein
VGAFAVVLDKLLARFRVRVTPALG